MRSEKTEVPDLAPVADSQVHVSDRGRPGSPRASCASSSFVERAELARSARSEPGQSQVRAPAHYDALGVHSSEAKDVQRVSIRLNDDMLDLDSPVRVDFKGEMLWDAALSRTVAVLGRCIQERGDPELVYSAEVTVALP